MQNAILNTSSQVSQTIPATMGNAIASPINIGKAAPEMRYAMRCANNKLVAKDGALLYCWNGNYWKVQSHDENGRHALLWLGKNEPKRATAATAESCVKTAILLANPLPTKSDQIIIPANGVWFKLNPQNSIVVGTPDPNIGISYRLAVNTVPPLGDYFPAPVPEDSLFYKFLKTSLPDESVRNLVQAFVGYSLAGNNTSINHQCAELWVGQGSNGKSVMLNIVRALHEKTVAMRLDKLDGFDLAALIGASLVTCDETPKGKINQQALKSIISGGALQITPKYGAPVTYQPYAKWIVCANHLPTITDHSHGWWRRWHIVEWSVQFTGKQIIPNLDQKIIQHEMHIVLDWALAGLQKLMQQGEFIIPQTVTQSTMDAKEESNSVTSWIANNGVALAPEDQSFNEKGIFYQSYKEYCHSHGFMVCNQSQFFKRVINHFPSMKESRQFRGVGSNKTRARCVNLTTGIFSPEDIKEQAGIEQAEINTAFGYE